MLAAAPPANAGEDNPSLFAPQPVVVQNGFSGDLILWSHKRKRRDERKQADLTVRAVAAAYSNASVPPAQNADENRKQRKDRPTEPEPNKTANEYMAFRENVAVLSGGSLEMSLGATYMRNSSFLQYDRATTANLGVRYGLFSGVELAVNVPYYYSIRGTQIGAVGNTNFAEVRSLGDVTAQVTALVSKETYEYPSVNLTVGATFPTGESPYSFGPGYVVTANPIDPLYNRQSRRQWGNFGAVQFVKTYDPIVFFWGFGYDYSFDTTIEGHRVSWPVKFTYNAGMVFAVSDKTSFGVSVVGSYQPDLKVDGALVPQSGTEPIVGRFIVDQKIANNFFLEPSVGIGLSKDAPNVSLSMTARYRFEPPPKESAGETRK
jgi:hypothetical protein